jgi:ClpP class serine protease
MMHTSVEKMLEQMGLEVTFVFAGAHKVDGNPYEALPKDVKARWQKSVERSYEKFVSLVERNRGMSADAVRATEALCYDAEEAVEIGLIDAIQTPAEALAAFRQELYGSNTNPQQGATTMSNTATAATGGAGNAAADPATPATTVEAPAAAATAPAAAVEAPAATVAAPTDERARIKAITTCDEAKGRETLAAHFAFDTDMSVEAARAALSAAPAAAAPAASGSPFVAAMEGTANPEVGSLGAEGGETATISPGDRIANSYAAVTGKPVLPARK